MEELSFEQIQKRLTEQFLRAERGVETDEELGNALLDLILQNERLRHNVKGPGPEQEKVDLQTLERLYHQTDLSTEHAVAEGVFKRLAKDPGHAIRHLKAAAKALSAQQANRAHNPRPGRYGSITKLINDIVADDLHIPAREVRRALLRIDGIVLLDGEIRNTQDGDTMKSTNLPSRVSDAIKRISG